jgi:hypothetical protein
MSVLPNVPGQSTFGAGRVESVTSPVAVPLRTSCRYGLIPEQTAALRPSFQTPTATLPNAPLRCSRRGTRRSARSRWRHARRLLDRARGRVKQVVNRLSDANRPRAGARPACGRCSTEPASGAAPGDAQPAASSSACLRRGDERRQKTSADRMALSRPRPAGWGTPPPTATSATGVPALFNPLGDRVWEVLPFRVSCPWPAHAAKHEPSELPSEEGRAAAETVLVRLEFVDETRQWPAIAKGQTLDLEGHAR